MSWRRQFAATLVAAGLALTSIGAEANTALAGPSIADARARAKAIALQVNALEIKAEAATEDYNAVQEKLALVISQYLTASQHVSDLGIADQARTEEASARVRALYRAGGPVGLYASVLEGTSFGDALSRYSAINRVLEADQNAVASGVAQLAEATRATDALDALATKRAQLEADAALAKARIEGLLADQQAQLASANGVVTQLVAAEQSRLAAVAAAAAKKTLSTDPNAPDTVPAGTPSIIATAIGFARTKLGAPYQWGATGPDTYDCSGLTQWAYGQAGLRLPRTSREQWFVGTHPTLGALLPGDLLYWATNASDPGSIHHVALYLGGGYMLEAPHTGAFVRIVPVYLDGYFGATRPLAQDGAVAP